MSVFLVAITWRTGLAEGRRVKRGSHPHPACFPEGEPMPSASWSNGNTLVPSEKECRETLLMEAPSVDAKQAALKQKPRLCFIYKPLVAF